MMVNKQFQLIRKKVNNYFKFKSTPLGGFFIATINFWQVNMLSNAQIYNYIVFMFDNKKPSCI